MESTFIKDIKYDIVEDSNETYHNNKEYISSTGLKKLKVSPAHYKEYLEEKKEPTPALIFGSAYHTYCLEVDKFHSQYYIFDEKDILEILISEGSQKPRSTNKYKDWVKEQEEEAAGKIMIDKPSFNKIIDMKAKMSRHFYCNYLLTTGVSEISVYATITTFEGKEIKIKVRPDKWNKKKCVVTDLKSIGDGLSDASIDGFAKQCANFDYHLSIALYADILEKCMGEGMGVSAMFIAQEKQAPYAFNIFDASNQFISQGRYEYENLLMLYSYCQENDYWPGYQVYCENKYGINELNLPAWAIKEINFYDHLRKND